MRYKGGEPPLMIYQACGLDEQRTHFLADKSAFFVVIGLRKNIFDKSVDGVELSWIISEISPRFSAL